MDFLQSLIDQYNIPILTAFLLGIMTAISPCPLATNITATAYISKNISRQKMVFLSGLIYSLGRAFSYTVIGVVLYFGASKFQIARFFNQNGEKFLGPLLIILGLIMLGAFNFVLSGNSNFTERFANKFKDKGLWGAFLLGVLFALAFCPYSGALYFGMLIPISISSPDGLYLPFIYAIGTGLPVIIFTYMLAFMANKVGLFYKRITQIEKAIRKVAGVIFILAGLYYVLIFTGVL